MTRLNESNRIKWERARDLKNKGAYPEAEKVLMEALEEQPDHPFLKASLADVQVRQDRLNEARILAEEILSVDPQDQRALTVLGDIYFKEKKMEEALQCFHHAEQRDQSPYMVRRIAKTLREMERYEEALETVDAALILHRENRSLLKEKAVILNRMMRHREALETYERVQALDPEDSIVRKEIIRLKGLERSDPNIIEELKAVLRVPSRGNDPQLHGLLAQRLKEAGKLEEAVEEYRIARRLAPHDFFFMKMEGFCHYRLGNDREAIHLLSQAFRHDPDDVMVKSTLEKLFKRIGRLEDYVRLLEGILADHPHRVKLAGPIKKFKKLIDEKAPRDS